MLLRRLSVALVTTLCAIGISTASLDAAGGDKQLARVKGIVGYEDTASAPFRAIFGRLDLPDNAFAVTQGGAQAILRMPDSSEIDIGENTKVQVGAFNATNTGQSNQIVLNNGALHFNIRHPVGGESNYRFTTATSQIAVRGTEGFLVSGASGTTVVCVSCAAGDVSVQTGSSVTSIVSGQTAIVTGSSAGTASVTVVSNSSVANSSSITQFNNTSTTTTSTTASTTTTTATGGAATTTTTTTAATSGSAGTVATVAGAGAATTAVVVASTAGTKSSAPGSIVASISIGSSTASAFSSFPVAFQVSATEANATSALTFTITPSNLISGLNVVQTSGPPSDAASATGQVTGPGSLSVTIAASGQTASATYNIWGPVTATPSSLSFTSPGTQSFSVAQAGPSGTLTLTPTCVAGASMTVQPTSGPSSGFSVNVTANTAPSSAASTAACTINVTGLGTGSPASTSIPVNITTTSIGISNTLRQIQNPVRSPR